MQTNKTYQEVWAEALTLVQRDLARLHILKAESVSGRWMDYYRYEDVWKVIKDLTSEPKP